MAGGAQTGVYTRVYELNPALDALAELGVDGPVLDGQRLLVGISDPARHWQETEDWRWMAKAIAHFPPDALSAKAVLGVMYDACCLLGDKAAFPLARNTLHVVSQHLNQGGTKKSVHDAHKQIKQAWYEGLFRSDDEEEQRRHEAQRPVLQALEHLTHLKRPLGQMASCLWHVSQALAVKEDEGGLADVLRGRLQNPFLAL